MARALELVRQRAARYLARALPADVERSSRPLRLRLPIRRGEMAHLIGTTPETLSRTLHALAAQGILEVHRREIRVLDLEALRRLAQ